MFTKRTIGFIYLARSGFTYYTDLGTPITFTYPSEYVQELEIKNEDAFVKNVTDFITANKIVPASVLILLSPEMIYEKEFIDEQPKPVVSLQESKDTNQQSQPIDPSKPLQPTEPMTPKTTLASHEERLREISFFIESVPFEETASKVFRIDRGLRVVVTNKRLFQTVRTAFSHLGFLVEAVVPMTMLGKEFGTLVGMNDELMKKILIRYEVVKINNLLQDDPSALATPTAPGHLQMSTKVQSKREYALIGVFVLLLLILGVIAYITFLPPKTKVASISQQPPAQVTIVPTSPQPTVATSSATASSSASLNINKANMRIIISGDVSGQAGTLKSFFMSDGFTNVTTKPSTLPATGKVLIVFSSIVPIDVREALLIQVKKVNSNIAVQENKLNDSDILINL
jgi:hypothetical protein